MERGLFNSIAVTRSQCTPLPTFCEMIRHRLHFLLFFCLLAPTLTAQRVGLVLSGGGAKGIAHIGMLQALEDNGIPIDYVAGTSIGAIVSGFYAMGYAPSDMMGLIKSPVFTNWMNGTIEEEYVNYFRQSAPTPEILSTDISLRDTVLKPGKILPTSLMNPVQMNYAYLELTAQYTALCRGDFNRLFVPFRSVAADVYARKPYVFRKGDLGDAIRTSMTFPFVFKAIKVNDRLLYDGGIYNNYPVDVMEKDFDPEVILGSVVVDINEKPDDYDMVAQLQTMIIQPSHYDVPADKGIQLTFNLKGVSLLDFHKADSLFRIGYDGTMAVMDSIKRMVHRRVSPFDLSLRRYQFRSHLPVLRFREIIINGTTETERQYLLKVLNQSGDAYFTLEDFKVGYFKLVADKKIKEILPHAVYNPEDESFTLMLDVEMNHSIRLAVGANLSSSTSNQVYLGLGFNVLDQYSQEYTLDTYMGKVYNALRAKAVIFSSDDVPKSFSAEFSSLNFNFFQGEKLFYNDDRPAFIKQRENFIRFRFAMPTRNNGKMEMGLSTGILRDEYMQSKLETVSNNRFDRSLYYLLNGTVRYDFNNLNAKQYPTSGQRNYLGVQLLTGMESVLRPDSITYLTKQNRNLTYAQFSAGFERYLTFGKSGILGLMGSTVINNKRPLDNYTASVIQAPGFTPTLHSKTAFNEAYRSNQYLALGLLPIWSLQPNLYLRTEWYGFFPWTIYERSANQKAVPVHKWSNIQYIAEASLVYSLPFASLSVFVNNYSYPKGNWNAGVNLGYLLFGSRFHE